MDAAKIDLSRIKQLKEKYIKAELFEWAVYCRDIENQILEGKPEVNDISPKLERVLEEIINKKNETGKS
jgi:hypothetical protein